MDLQSTPLKGIVRSSEDGLFYLFPHSEFIYIARDERAFDLCDRCLE